MTDRIEAKHMVFVGALISGILFALRSYVTTSIEAFLLSFGAGLAFMLYYVPLYSTLADYAEDEDVLEFYALREVFLAIGRITVLLLALFLAATYSLGVGMKAAFFLTAVATALIPVYSKWVKI